MGIRDSEFLQPAFLKKRPHESLAPEGRPPLTILLVDSDLGFVFWLGQSLDMAGYSAIPAKDITAATELIRVHRPSVNILVIDPFLDEAFSFISFLRKSHPLLKVVATVPENWGEFPSIAEVDAVIPKPRHLTAAATSPWITLVQNLYSASVEALSKTFKL